MKKIIKKSVALILSVILTSSLALITPFAAYNSSYLIKSEAVEDYYVASGVRYTEYNVSSGYLTSSGGRRTATYSTEFLTFSPDDYVPIVYSRYAGSTSTLSSQYTGAKNAGYDVVAAINGSFFAMNTGWLLGLNISNGRIWCAHAGYSDSVVTFGADGRMNIVDSYLSYELSFDGNIVPSGIYYINKHTDSGSWNERFYYFDSACGTKCDSKSSDPGYEIICNKLDGTELTVGGTLRGEVVEIKKNSYASAIGENQFVLFCLSDSSYASYVESLEIGSDICITVQETIASSREVMENASSAITNVGWLVKDGVDKTLTESTIGTHSVEYMAQWTAFGVKANGDYVFYTNSGSSGSSGLTLQDVAKLMIQEGCVNVIRMDGGGSSSMYVSNTGSGSAGYKLYTTRPVADTIMVVKRSSAGFAYHKNALESAVASAEASLAESERKIVRDAYNDALSVLAKDSPINSELIRANMNLVTALRCVEDIGVLMKRAEDINPGKYSDYGIGIIRSAYDNACSVINNSDSLLTDYTDAVSRLILALGESGRIYENLSQGASYTYSASPNASYPDSYKKELTDGYYASATDPYDSGWVGLNSSRTFSVTVDLGEYKTGIDKVTMNFLGQTDWGIVLPSSIDVSYSPNNTAFVKVGTANNPKDSSHNGVVLYELTLDEAFDARYVRITVNGAGAFAFFDELTVERSHDPITNYIYVNTANKKVTNAKTVIFTDKYYSLTSADCNTVWSFVTVFAPAGNGIYSVTQKWDYPAASTVFELPEGGFAIAAHVDAYSTSDMSSYENAEKLRAMKIGDLITTNGIDVENGIASPGSYLSRINKDGVTVRGDSILLKSEKESVSAFTECFYTSVNVKKLSGMTYVSTGATAEINGKTYTVLLMGDIDGDAEINVFDYMKLKRNIIASYEISEASRLASDIDSSGDVTAADYVLIKRHVLGKYDILG